MNLCMYDQQRRGCHLYMKHDDDHKEEEQKKKKGTGSGCSLEGV